MPIYEYYCRVCGGRFSHLARRFDAPPPHCPRCGSDDLERLVSRVNVIQTSGVHQTQLKEEAARVDGDDPQAAARFLQASGRLEGAQGLYGSKAYRELIARRAAGAMDSDLGDLVDDLVAAADTTSAMEMAGAVALAKQVDNRIGAEGPPEGHEHGSGLSADDSQGLDEADPKATMSQQQESSTQSRRSADDLGWG